MRHLASALVFAAAVAGLGWVVGGQALLDRIDPALGVPMLLPPALLLMRHVRRAGLRSRLVVAAMALFALIVVQGWLAWALAGTLSPAQLVACAFAAAIAMLLADQFWSWRKQRSGRQGATAGLLMLLAALWFVAGHAALSLLYAPRNEGFRLPQLVVMSSLPLRWGGAPDVAAALRQGTAPAPALARLEADFAVRLVDSFADQRLPDGAVLLLAHPRALPPADLVAIDAFVRSGGRAIILADALSGWPVDFPLGDARNPPTTSLLTPLLDHWGVTLGAAAMADQKPVTVDLDGRRVTLFSAGAFDRLPMGCRSYAERRIADCPIGAGRVWLVGDADLLFAPLWQSPVPGATYLRRADNMEWLGTLISGGGNWGRGILNPQWIRQS